MTSLIGQIDRLFKQHRGTGQSRRKWRDKNAGFGKMSPVTFAWASEKRYRSVCIQFIRFCRERYHIQAIKEIATDMVRAYIDERKASGLSPRTIATEITALRRLGLYAVIEKWLGHNFVPDDLSVPHGSRPRYSYAPEHAAKIIDSVTSVDRLAGDVLRMQLHAGLRINEAVRLRLDRIDFEHNTLEVKGKGGKIRTITLPDPSALAMLDRSKHYPLLQGNAISWTRRIEQLVQAACAEHHITCLGTHGFRASAAQRTLDDLLDSGMSERDARKQVSQLLGHNRTSVTRSYAP